MLQVVLDTNILLSAYKSSSATSPNREIFDRLEKHEFEFLFSEDILLEYRRKLIEKDFSPDQVRTVLKELIRIGSQVFILRFHLPAYPSDPEDIMFVLCADNGNATHIVTYDDHLLVLEGRYTFRICEPLPFLGELRALSEK